MALLASSPCSQVHRLLNISKHHHYATAVSILFRPNCLWQAALCSQLSSEPTKIAKSELILREARSDAELWAASYLHVHTFFDYSNEERREDAFESRRQRIAGKQYGCTRASCIIASLPISTVAKFSDDLCTTLPKVSIDREDRLIVGSLDLEHRMNLLDGKAQEEIGANSVRGYLDNVCVAKELRRNGLGAALIEKSKMVASAQGLTDLYLHVVDKNDAAKNLFMKCGFTEPKAKFSYREGLLLLWYRVTNANEM